MTASGHEELKDLSGLCVVGALAADERVRFEAHLRECAACANARALASGRGSRAWRRHDPPAALRGRC
jgi:hypothetical protein